VDATAHVTKLHIYESFGKLI